MSTPLRLGYRSIANNLALLHILAVFVTFTIGSVLLYMKLLDNLNQEADRDIRSEIVRVRSLLQSPNGLDLIENAMQMQFYDMESLRPYIRLIDRQGRIIAESPRMGKLLPVSVFPPPDSHLKWRIPTGELFLLKTDLLPENLYIATGGQLQIGFSIADSENLAKLFRNSLIFFSLGGLIFAFISSHIVTRLGLKPLNDISTTVREITESHLNTRIDAKIFPVEIQSLVGSFNSMLESLENSFRKLAQYSENLAHELRTPLNNLVIEADVALSRDRSPEEYREVIGSSLEEFERLSLLIDRLLFLARADNRQFRLTVQQFDAFAETENIAEYYSETATAKRVGIVIEGNASLSADAILFRRAIGNLLANAINYTPEDGSVIISIRELDDSSVEVSVRDTGCGIEPELLPKIFDRYFWVEATRHKDPKGAGLGLDIVKAIMRLHGGTASIASEVEVGTVVTLTFPGRAVSSHNNLM